MPALEAAKADFDRLNAQVVGISVDSIPSHIAWQKYKIGMLTYPLASDFYPHADVVTRYGLLRLVGAGFRLAHGSPRIDREPPTLGEHTDEILQEAGYSAGEIERLHRDAVV